MGQALYRKYRSKSLGEIVGQEHITRTLSNALSRGVTSHAYLFTGPRGVGKTSIARILAYEINNIPYDENATHLDIIEIDAASNRRIDEIRDLRDRARISPTSAKYKVYIIDEVHMLTKEAFNALLKTLEEPPAHAIFILATTEVHKLPDTIVSRTQRFTFRPISSKEVVSHLRFISEQEKLEVSDEALELIAVHGGGSFRDSISLLDQTRGLGTIDETEVRRMLGIAPDEAIEALINSLEHRNIQSLIQQLEDLRHNGYPASGLAKQLSVKLREKLQDGSLPTLFITSLLKSLIEVPASHDPETLLEVILIESVTDKNSAPAPTAITKPVTHKSAVKKPEKTTEEAEASHAPENKQETNAATKEPVIKKESKPAKKKSAKPLDEETWSQALLAVKQKHNTLYSVVRMAEPSFDGDDIVLSFRFAFHQKRINETKNKQIITDILTKSLNKPIQIECVVDASASPKPDSIEKAEVQRTDSNDISTISNIFGSAEVVE